MKLKTRSVKEESVQVRLPSQMPPKRFLVRVTSDLRVVKSEGRVLVLVTLAV